MKEFLYSLISRLLVSSLSVVCFLNSSWGGFVFDDSEAITGNKDVNPNTSLSRVFRDDFWGTDISLETSHKSYRPLTILTFRWNYWWAGGLEPFGFHLVNVILHPIVTLLYVEVCHRIVDDWSVDSKSKESASGGQRDALSSGCVSLLAGLMFAVHPVHTESVAGVVGRADLTSALCFFSTLLCYIKACKTGSLYSMFLWVVLACLFGGCGTLFKEQGITALGVCIVYDIIINLKLDPLHIAKLKAAGHSWRKWAVRNLLLVLCIGAILLARLSTGRPEFKPTDNPASFSDSLLTRVLTYNYLYSLNAWLLVNPWWLCFDWSMGCIALVESIADTRVMAVLAFWFFFGSLVIYCLVGKPGPFKRNVTMALAMVVVPFLPASNVFLRVGFVIAERVLYLPSAGYCLLVAMGLSVLLRHLNKHVCFTLFVSLILLQTSRSVQRSSEWLSEKALFTAGVRVCPHNAKVLYNIGKVKADAGNTMLGEAAYREAIRLFPEYDQALNNFGNLLKETGRPVEAETMFLRALKANPEFAAAWMNLGIVQAVLNKTDKAEVSYKTAIKHRKKYPDAYYNLGNMYIDLGRTAEAVSAFKAAISLQRDHSNAWGNLGLLYENLQMYSEAEGVLREAVSIIPDNAQFYYSLGVLLGRVNRLDEGQEMLERAIKMKPTSANYHANLGVIYHLKKDYDSAEYQYRHALKFDPDLATAKDNLNKLLKTRRKLSRKQ